MDPFDLRLWLNFGLAGGNLNEPAIVDQIVIDSRRIGSQRSLFVALKGAKQDGHQYIHHAAQMGAKYALVSHHYTPSPNLLNGITLLYVPDPLKAFQEIAKAYRQQLDVQIIGITGSFGKTMVKDLLYKLLNTEMRAAASPESFNSQIGVPLSLLTLRKSHQIAVIEAAISKKEEMIALSELIHPTYTLLTPIGKKHLATLGSLNTTVQELMQLIFKTSPEGWALIPKDSLLKEYYTCLPCPYYFWNEEESGLPYACSLKNQAYTPTPYKVVFPDQEQYQGYAQTGHHYFFNLLNMATKAAWLLGVRSNSISAVLDSYQIEPTRTEIWKSPIGATFINDTYCSDPQSIDLALKHFDYAEPNHRKIFVFGGMREQSIHREIDYEWIGKSLHKINLDQLILFGKKPFDSLIRTLRHFSSKIQIDMYSTYEEALNALYRRIQSQDIVLVKGDQKASFDLLTETFNDSLNNNQCTINLAAIQSNISTLRKKLPEDTRIMIMVKALAYGTDDICMAKFLATCGIDILGVSYVDEGVALRRAGIKQAIFSINAAVYEAAKVVKWDLEVGVSDTLLIQAIATEAQKQNKRAKLHLHINTGMSRFGCRPEQALELALLICQSPYLILEGIMTHLACAEDSKEDAFTQEQIRCFDEVIAELNRKGIQAQWTHAANSSGVIRFHLPQYNMVRVGLAAYGLYVSEETRQALDLHLALSLTSRVVGINICKKGESISYGRKYKVDKETQKIAVLPIGYFDGLHRHYSGRACVFINGYPAPMVGNICMDYMMVDVTDIPEVSIGDKVLVFGEDDLGQYLSPEDLANRGNSIIHELITCLGPRIQRIFIFEEGHQIR